MASFRGEFLAFSDFKSLVSRALSASAAPGPRRYLLPDRGEASVYMAVKEKEQREQQRACSFKPTIGHKSEALAGNRRQPGMPINEHLLAAQAEFTLPLELEVDAAATTQLVEALPQFRKRSN